MNLLDLLKNFFFIIVVVECLTDVDNLTSLSNIEMVYLFLVIQCQCLLIEVLVSSPLRYGVSSNEEWNVGIQDWLLIFFVVFPILLGKIAAFFDTYTWLGPNLKHSFSSSSLKLVSWKTFEFPRAWMYMFNQCFPLTVLRHPKSRTAKFSFPVK